VAEITVTINGAAGFIPDWGAVSFDHAALVAAGRSRADGLDFYMRHTGGATVWIKGRTGLNTATATVTFIAVGAGVDSGYRLGFGDLGWQTDRAGGPASSTSGSVTTASVPAVTLPAPGFVVERTQVRDAWSIEFPDTLSPRARAASENERETVSVTWANVSPEDWYEIRAFLRAQAGGASTFTAPAWLGSGTWAIVPGSYSGDQFSRRGYRASLAVESVIA